MRIYNKAKDTQMHHKIKKMLRRIASKKTVARNVWTRAKIVLDVVAGVTDRDVALLHEVGVNLVARWRKRFIEALPTLERIAQKRPEILEQKVIDALSDNVRPGRPLVFDAICRSFIIGIACNRPEDYGFVRSHWSLPTLQRAVINKKVAASISCTTISRILGEEELQPHKNRYWLHSMEKDENPYTYKQKILEINGIYFTAAMINRFGGESDMRIISTDEMTGIQALEHKHPDKLAMPHMTAKIEFEYIRHGTTTLIGFFDVVTGKIVSPYLNKTRKSEDFAEALESLIANDPEKHWVIIADNLNIHYSEPVVRLVADKCGITDIDETGALSTIDSRIEFLTDSSHRIRFAFTPKHCSWMNQIEIWFSIINRQLLKRRSFASIDELKAKILEFINQYNSMFAKPFKWKYHTTPLGDLLC